MNNNSIHSIDGDTVEEKHIKVDNLPIENMEQKILEKKGELLDEDNDKEKSKQLQLKLAITRLREKTLRNKAMKNKTKSGYIILNENVYYLLFR